MNFLRETAIQVKERIELVPTLILYAMTYQCIYSMCKFLFAVEKTVLHEIYEVEKRSCFTII